MAAEARRQGWRVVAFAFAEAPGLTEQADAVVPSRRHETSAPSSPRLQAERVSAARPVRKVLDGGSPRTSARPTPRYAAMAGGTQSRHRRRPSPTCSPHARPALASRSSTSARSWATGSVGAAPGRRRAPTETEWDDVRRGLAGRAHARRRGRRPDRRRPARCRDRRRGRSRAPRRRSGAARAQAGPGAVVVKAAARDHDYRFDTPGHRARDDRGRGSGAARPCSAVEAERVWRRWTGDAVPRIARTRPDMALVGVERTVSRAPTIMLVAGEASGDLHGAALCQALRVLAPDCRLVGMGGPRMAAAGLERHGRRHLHRPPSAQAGGARTDAARSTGAYRGFATCSRAPSARRRLCSSTSPSSTCAWRARRGERTSRSMLFHPATDLGLAGRPRPRRSGAASPSCWRSCRSRPRSTGGLGSRSSSSAIRCSIRSRARRPREAARRRLGLADRGARDRAPARAAGAGGRAACCRRCATRRTGSLRHRAPDALRRSSWPQRSTSAGRDHLAGGTAHRCRRGGGRTP